MPANLPPGRDQSVGYQPSSGSAHGHVVDATLLTLPLPFKAVSTPALSSTSNQPAVSAATAGNASDQNASATKGSGEAPVMIAQAGTNHDQDHDVIASLQAASSPFLAPSATATTTDQLPAPRSAPTPVTPTTNLHYTIPCRGKIGKRKTAATLGINLRAWPGARRVARVLYDQQGHKVAGLGRAAHERILHARKSASCTGQAWPLSAPPPPRSAAVANSVGPMRTSGEEVIVIPIAVDWLHIALCTAIAHCSRSRTSPRSSRNRRWTSGKTRFGPTVRPAHPGPEALSRASRPAVAAASQSPPPAQGVYATEASVTIPLLVTAEQGQTATIGSLSPLMAADGPGGGGLDGGATAAAVAELKEVDAINNDGGKEAIKVDDEGAGTDVDFPDLLDAPDVQDLHALNEHLMNAEALDMPNNELPPLLLIDAPDEVNVPDLD
ncbi:hypothetical protein AMAG_00060 [Allomyces macrogynus ATCC 38327]|uniref:Uncharacterized protein n=1 Tax=Allomyces macrogynus (strain ATCC 38327) TaxID=578462 RepID=A0A0L0RVA2_ALLM3|nr:hypothetical protein AMAG_00060 [Allomyces macrogynus ATCC 38327]|eukprot:KNE54059.1 hypothetical protein AMAG_00060 [Allomyces macrogynus ATCC 38327]